jgi:hypothetical protein
MKKQSIIVIGLLFILGGANWFAYAANQESARAAARKVTAVGTLAGQGSRD